MLMTTIISLIISSLSYSALTLDEISIEINACLILLTNLNIIKPTPQLHQQRRQSLITFYSSLTDIQNNNVDISANIPRKKVLLHFCSLCISAPISWYLLCISYGDYARDFTQKILQTNDLLKTATEDSFKCMAM